MKRIIRAYAISLLALYITRQVAQGLVFDGGAKTFLLTGLALTAVQIVAKPIINLLLLPLNLITFGVFRWVSSAIALYLVTLLVDGFKIDKFFFQGFNSMWFDLPQLTFHGILAFVAFSFVLSVVTSFIYWIRK